MTYSVASGHEKVTWQDFVVLAENFKNNTWKRNIDKFLFIKN